MSSFVAADSLIGEEAAGIVSGNVCEMVSGDTMSIGDVIKSGGRALLSERVPMDSNEEGMSKSGASGGPRLSQLPPF